MGPDFPCTYNHSTGSGEGRVWEDPWGLLATSFRFMHYPVPREKVESDIAVYFLLWP